MCSVSSSSYSGDDNSNMLKFDTHTAPPYPPPFSTQTDPVVCSNPEDTPPLSTIEPVIYSAVVREMIIE